MTLQRLLLVVLLAAVGACSSDEPSGSGPQPPGDEGRLVRIVGAEVESDFTTLHLMLDVCQGNLTYAVDASSGEDIKVGVRAISEMEGAECGDTLTLVLQSTLDFRPLIDSTTGKVVEVVEMAKEDEPP